MSTHSAPVLGSLASRLSELSLRDAHRLGRRLEGARKIRKPEARAAVLGEIEAEVAAATERMAARRARVPEVRYPEQLPVSQKKDAIAEAIRDHQVVIVAGETGSGKTTQIPKICMELGRGVRGMIGHTQPRRIAARTVAERVAEELDTPLGEAVGWKVRFTDQVDPEATFIKLMTDGILLAEIQTDRELRAYDTIIIDEAHERSLNIDFLLGYLAQLLPKRPDLKLVITSATIDPERFSRHFGDAPIIEVSGRTYPVEVRYRPLLEENPDDAEDADRDQITAITDAVEELMAEGPGDILVFLSGEREIRDTADALNKKRYRSTEVLPLYARLSHAEQHRVFQQHSGRRIVLATNVAETSLTVPGIKYVIDPGFARISRYSHRTKVQRLPIEPISQASANQRKGRCGRTSDGICIRLYSEDDFLSRPEFTDAEILRTNLASVILQMTAATSARSRSFPSSTRRTTATSVTASSCSRNSARSTRRRRTRASASHRPGGSWRSCRWTRAWRAWCWRRTRTAASARSWSSRPRCPSRTRGSGPPTSRRRPTSSTPGSATRPATSSPSSTCGGTSANSRRSAARRRSAGCASRST